MADNNQLQNYTEAEALQIVCKIVTQMINPRYEDDVTPDASMESIFHSDRLEKAEIEMGLADKFGIPEYALNEEFDTINDIMKYLRENYGFKDSPKIIVALIMTTRRNQNVTVRQKER